MILSILISTTMAWAQEKSAFEQSLEQDTSVTSSESVVRINQKVYRKIEFGNGLYYVVFHKGKDVADVYCAPPGSPRDHEGLLEESHSFRRNAAFARAFHESCSKTKGNQRTDLHITPEMGIGVEVESKGMKD